MHSLIKCYLEECNLVHGLFKFPQNIKELTYKPSHLLMVQFEFLE